MHVLTKIHAYHNHTKSKIDKNNTIKAIFGVKNIAKLLKCFLSTIKALGLISTPQKPGSLY